MGEKKLEYTKDKIRIKIGHKKNFIKKKIVRIFSNITSKKD